MIENLFKKRIKQHYTMLFKYFKYVFNDFFLIAVMFMLGGLSLAYSNFLNQLSPSNLFFKWFVVLVLLLATKIGSLATFLKEADRVFLLPIESKMTKYLKYAFLDSLIVSVFFELLIFLIAFPMMKILFHANLQDFISYILVLIILKVCDLLVEEDKLFVKKSNSYYLIINFSILLIIVICLMVQLILGILLAIILLGFLLYSVFKNQKNRLKWDLAISNESHRMRRIYQFFNLFTEVPFLRGKVARRKYLDFIFNHLNIKDANLFLYLKGLIRNKEYSGLFIRLTVLGTVLLFFVDNIYLNIGLAVLFVYLIGFQLVPFYYFFDDNVFTHIYPLKIKDRVRSFKHLIYSLLIITILLFTSATAFFSLKIALISLVVMIVEIIAMNEFYLSKKLK